MKTNRIEVSFKTILIVVLTLAISLAISIAIIGLTANALAFESYNIQTKKGPYEINIALNKLIVNNLYDTGYTIMDTTNLNSSPIYFNRTVSHGKYNHFEDFTGDGIPEMVEVESSNSIISIMKLNTNNVYRSWNSFKLNQVSYISNIVVADIDGNGFKDIIALQPNARRLIAVYGTAVGKWRQEVFATLTEVAVAMNLNYIQGSPVINVSTVSGRVLTIYQDASTGKYEVNGTTVEKSGRPLSMHIVPSLFDDGVTKIVIFSARDHANIDNGNSIFVGDIDNIGNITNVKRIPTGIETPLFIKLVDLDNDGDQDILLGGYNGEIKWFYNDSFTFVGDKVEFTSIPVRLSSMVNYDVNNDGIKDIVTVGPNVHSIFVFLLEEDNRYNRNNVTSKDKDKKDNGHGNDESCYDSSNPGKSTGCKKR
jgi:hypothetical protein